MRSSKSRSRNKSNRQRTLGNIVNRVFDSSGPEGKVRGTPQQIIEKYLTLARDAQLSGDRVAEQSFFQHAEHYTRMLGEAQREMAERQAQQGGPRDDEGGQQHGGNGHSNGNGNSGGYRDSSSYRDNQGGRDQQRDSSQQRDGGQRDGQQRDGGQRQDPREQGQRDAGQRDRDQREGSQREGGQRESGPRHHEARDTRQNRTSTAEQPAEPSAPRLQPQSEPAQPEMDLTAPADALPPAVGGEDDAEGPVATPETAPQPREAQPEGEAPAKAPRARRPRSTPAAPRAPAARNRRKPTGDGEGGEAKAPAEGNGDA